MVTVIEPARALTGEEVALARSLLIHEDAQVLGFAKPAGLATQGGSGVALSLDDLMAAFAKSNGKKPRLVHRLDRETSGVILAARTQPAAAFLSEAFAQRRVDKVYQAIVCGGAPEPASGMVDLPMVKESRKGLDRMRVARAGEPGALAAQTTYQTLAATAAAAHLQLTPATGRMHQIRVHLAAIGRPILGDGKYGGLFAIGAYAAARLMLHAARLDVPHPGGGRLALEAAPPAPFKQSLQALGFAP